ncbi:lecithin retinol acyltransferase family protein [Aeromonas sp. Prich7-2]|nr:lecithin retinol acyltransferase family protein [Aeromonas sp. Prich7-2]MBP4061169.1 lecithin retinol acyltransferase family protein [Aeromonas sp. Prich7-2]
MYPIGAHLVTPRTGYDHHGIYVGNGKVVHYAGFARGFNTGP